MTADDKDRKDDTAIVRAISAHLRVVRAILRERRIPEAEHDDLCQEVMLIVWDAARAGLDWQNRNVLRSYMRTISERVAIAEHYARRRRGYLGRVIVEARDEPVVPTEEVAATELLALMQAATKPERWEVIVLHAQGRSIPFIAKRLRIPVGTGYTLLRTGRIDLAKMLRTEAEIHAGRRRAKPKK